MMIPECAPIKSRASEEIIEYLALGTPPLKKRRKLIDIFTKDWLYWRGHSRRVRQADRYGLTCPPVSYPTAVDLQSA